MDDKQTTIHSKGFSMYAATPTDYSKIKVGPKTLEDGTFELGSLRRTNINYFDKGYILRKLAEGDLKELRAISRFYYDTNGIYSVACNYYANLYRYDWYISSEVTDQTFLEDEDKKAEVLKNYQAAMSYLDDTHIRKICADIALDVILDGVYYGIKVPLSNSMSIQKLPPNYCRSRFNVGASPTVEFNMQFFDDAFPDASYRKRILKLFPEDMQRGYNLYKQRKLVPDFSGDIYGSWYLLDPDSTVKFTITQSERPMFVNAIPEILDLDAAQDLSLRKQMQQLSKIIVQTLPRDKNGDLIFDIDEATDIHNNAVAMLKKVVGADVLTTFADISMVDLSDNSTSANSDELKKVERTVYNALGIPQNLFNSEGSVALEKSILNDESIMRRLLLQFHIFFDGVVKKDIPQVRSKKKYGFRFYMLETTQYNYRDLSKMYKEQTQIGFSKMMPQVALGHSQSSIVNMAYFENKILHLSSVMIPPLMSSTLSSEDLLDITGQSVQGETQVNTGGDSSSSGGRPELDDDQKSEKTIANIESQQ